MLFNQRHDDFFDVLVGNVIGLKFQINPDILVFKNVQQLI